jgi:hypothetical protein
MLSQQDTIDFADAQAIGRDELSGGRIRERWHDGDGSCTDPLVGSVRVKIATAGEYNLVSHRSRDRNLALLKQMVNDQLARDTQCH